LFGANGLCVATADPLLPALLDAAPICDIQMERFLAMARRALLDAAGEMSGSADGIGFYTSAPPVRRSTFPVSRAPRDLADLLLGRADHRTRRDEAATLPLPRIGLEDGAGARILLSQESGLATIWLFPFFGFRVS
jgi:hypothetical protein